MQRASRSTTPRLVTTLGALALGLVAALAAPAHANPVEIVFASGPDETGTVQRLVDGFNAAHEGQIEVTWRAMDRDNNAHRAKLVADLGSDSGDVDLVAADVVWTAELARERLVEDVTRRFYRDYEREAFLEPAMDSATYRMRVWGVPWYTDAGVLYYRKDSLARGGHTAPPATWDELGDMALSIVLNQGVKHGFVFQGAEYEGGTVNASEFIWSAGGEIMTSRLWVSGVTVQRAVEVDAVKVDSEEAARGLDAARKLVAAGAVPAEVVSFREKEALDAFAAGDAVFLRSWPYAYGVLRGAELGPEQIGVAALPSVSADVGRASCLGGWNLMLNRRSSRAEQDAAWMLVRYLTDPAQQKRQALEAGLLPVVASLYDDAELVDELPAAGLGKELFASQLRSRPKSPLYGEMSASIARVFGQTLRGELDGAAAVKQLDTELRAIAIRNR